MTYAEASHVSEEQSCDVIPQSKTMNGMIALLGLSGNDREASRFG